MHGRSIRSVSERRSTAVGPVDQPVAEVEVKIDWLGQVVVKNFDVLAVCRSLTLWDLEASTENASLARVVISFLCPVEFAAVHINCDTNAPIPRVKPVGLAMARFNERFDI